MMARGEETTYSAIIAQSILLKYLSQLSLSICNHDATSCLYCCKRHVQGGKCVFTDSITIYKKVSLLLKFIVHKLVVHNNNLKEMF